MSKNYHPPVYDAKKFTCPHCMAISSMDWVQSTPGKYPFKPTMMAVCQGCDDYSLWVPTDENVGFSLSLNPPEYKLVFPSISQAPTPEENMPEDIKIDFEEARQVFGSSPRAAAALLRLCVQKLCHHLLGKPGGIHQQIVELVDKGLPSRALRAFDTIRIFGNESVHPGTINLNDTPEVALILFNLMNMAVRHCITEEMELEAIRALTPENKRLDI